MHSHQGLFGFSACSRWVISVRGWRQRCCRWADSSRGSLWSSDTPGSPRSRLIHAPPASPDPSPDSSTQDGPQTPQPTDTLTSLKATCINQWYLWLSTWRKYNSLPVPLSLSHMNDLQKERLKIISFLLYWWEKSKTLVCKKKKRRKERILQIGPIWRNFA